MMKDKRNKNRAKNLANNAQNATTSLSSLTLSSTTAPPVPGKIDPDNLIGPLPSPGKFPVTGILKTNHFRVIHNEGLVLYRYMITDIRAPNPKPESKSDTKEPAPAGKPQAISKPCTGPEPSGPRQPEDDDAPAGHAEASDTQANLKSRKLRRLLVLLLDKLNAALSPAKVASNLKDQLISLHKIDEIDTLGHISVLYYDEDQVNPRESATCYTIHFGAAEPIGVGNLSAYLGQCHTRSMSDFGFNSIDEVHVAQAQVANALNIIFSHYANLRTVRRAPALPAPPPYHSTEPEVAHVGSQKFFQAFRDSFTLGTNKDGPWTVPSEPHLASVSGYFRSARAPFGTNLLLNVNATTGAFYRSVALNELLRLRFGNVGNTPWQHVENFIRGLRVRTSYMISSGVSDHERICTVTGLPGTHDHHKKQEDKTTGKKTSYPWTKGREPTPKNVEFVRDGKTVTISDYFRKERGIALKDNDFIARLGREGPLIPMSMLRVLPGQYWSEKTELVRQAQRDPNTNYQLIAGDGQYSAAKVLGWIPGTQDAKFHKPFGVSVETDKGIMPKPQLMDVNASAISQPQLLYKGGKVADGNPWNIDELSVFSSAGQPGQKNTWTLVKLQQNLADATFGTFASKFRIQMDGYGLRNFTYRPSAQRFLYDQNQNQNKEQQIFNALQSIKRAQDAFVVVYLGDRTIDEYALLKKIADTQVHINVACCVFKRLEDGTGSITTQTSAMRSMSMKINLKSSPHSIDRQLVKTPGLLEGDTMVVGMDVTHPGMGAVKGAPSVAAMVASHDKAFAQWPASIKANPHLEPVAERTREESQKSQEKIVRLKDMLTERLECYRRFNAQKLPTKIIFYRDGLSEGQFDMCKQEEIPQLRQAINAVYQSQPKPRIMVVCAVKRHQTRFYQRPGNNSNNDPLTTPKGQIKPGTVVYEKVTHGLFQDFFLASQVAALGTCRPTHYVVLESDFGKEYNIIHVAEATYALCYLFGTCHVSVGLVPAAYYADKACDRARCYVRQWYVGNSSEAVWNPADNASLEFDFGDLKDRMFYL